MKLITRGLNANRRSFMKKALAVLGAASASDRIFADDENGNNDNNNNHGELKKGDAALLRFAAALEILESDFWIQYNELGGIQDSEVSGGSGIAVYTAALKNLDADFDQYIHDNTDDEITHFSFLNAYLMSKGAAPANLDQFRTLHGSTATGVNTSLIGKRLTNLTQLTLDTSKLSRRFC